MITVRNLIKRFGDVEAVRDISFEVEKGEVMGFLGPNGAGKTTTLRTLTGYLPATSGTVLVDGLDVLRDSLKVRQRIGYLPETVPLYLEMRVEEYLRFRAALKGVTRRDLGSYVDQAMERCGLTHMRRRIVGQLSKGYRQRVGLADALVQRPPILILDEPTGGLDPHQRKEVLQLIHGLSEEHTVLLSSHVLAEVESISQRVMIIQQGRLLAVGRPDELTDKLQESPHVVLEVQWNKEALTALLTGLPAEDRGDWKVTAQEDGWQRAELRPATGRDPRARLGELLGQASVPIRELTRVQLNLEELFLRITAQQAQRHPQEVAP